MTQPYLFDILETDARRRAASKWRGSTEPREVARPLEITPYRGGPTAGGRVRARDRRIGALRRILDSGRAAGRILALGTRFDPYPAEEGERRLTRRALEELARRSGWTIRARTSSPLLLRDLDLLRAIDRRNGLRVEVPLMSRDDGLLQALEPEAPEAAARLALLEELGRAGIAAGVAIAPVVPGLTDSLGNLEAVVRAARSRGARFVTWSPLVLEPPVDRPRRPDAPATVELFLARVKSVKPQVAGRLERIYDGRGQAPPFCKRLIATRMRELKLKYGFGEPDGAGFVPAARPPSRATRGR